MKSPRQPNDIRFTLANFSGAIIAVFALFMSPLYVGGLIEQFGLSEAEAGMMLTVEIGAIAVTTFLLAPWLHLFKMRKLAFMGVAVVLLSNGLSFWLVGITTIGGTRVLVGIGTAMVLVASASVVSRISDPDKAVAYVTVGVALSLSVLLIVASEMKAYWGYRGVCVVFAAVSILALLGLWQLPNASNGKSEEGLSSSLDSSLFVISAFALLAVALVNLTDTALWGFSERVAERLQLSESTTGMVLSAAQVAALFGASTAIVLGDRLPRLVPILMGLLLLGTGGYIVYNTDSVVLFVVSLLGGSYGLFVVFPYLLGACARVDKAGHLMALAGGAQVVGGAVGPALAGAVIEASGYQGLGSLIVALTLASAVFCILFVYRMHAHIVNDGRV